MSQVFCALTSVKTAAFIRTAQHRVVLCVPAMNAGIAEALMDTVSRLGRDAVRVIADCDEEVFRLGYGEIEAQRRLCVAKVDVRQCPGLRLGLLVVDERAWAFTPTALYVQPEAHSDETPNAFVLDGAGVEQAISALGFDINGMDSDQDSPEAEIGNTSLGLETIESVENSLKIAPPMPFDIARQVRVFQPYIQYVDVHLTGCAIQRQRVTIPKSIQGLGASSEIEDRLRTTFDLVERSSSISSRTLESDLRKIVTDLSRSLGKPWGRVMLRTARPLFEQRIQEFRKKVETHKKNVEKELEEHLAYSLNNVLDYYLPFVKEHPPDALVGQTLPTELRDADIQKWLLDQLKTVFPKTDEIVSEMKLNVQYRDVTYETLSDGGFCDALRKAYPYVDWDKPFHEFNAAKEKLSRKISLGQ